MSVTTTRAVLMVYAPSGRDTSSRAPPAVQGAGLFLLKNALLERHFRRLDTGKMRLLQIENNPPRAVDRVFNGFVMLNQSSARLLHPPQNPVCLLIRLGAADRRKLRFRRVLDQRRFQSFRYFLCHYFEPP